MSSALMPAAEVVERALALGGEGTVVIVEESSEAEVRFANNTTTTNGQRRNRRVIVVRLAEVEGGIAAGTASRTGAPDLAELVAAAGEEAAGSPPSPDAMDLLTPEAAAARSADFADPPPTTDLGILRPVLAGLTQAFTRAAQQHHVLAGFAEHRMETVYLGTSTGLRLRHAQPTGALHLVGRSDGGAASAWVGRSTDDFADIDVESIQDRLAERLGWAARTVALDAGRYEVILPPEAVADLMMALYDAAGGQDAEDGRTVFSAPDGRTRVGDTLSALPFDLWSDPNAPGLECSPFLVTGASGSEVSVYDNGLPLRRTHWIEQGRLNRLRYHRAGAARSGVAPTGPVDNLVLELPGAEATLEDLIGRTERGLLLTCLWYIRDVDPAQLLLTGLTRDGVYLVEEGQVVGAVNNFRFNESPVDVLARTIEAGTATPALGREFGEWMYHSAMPPLRVADFNMSSVSQAS